MQSLPELDCIDAKDDEVRRRISSPKRVIRDETDMEAWKNSAAHDMLVVFIMRLGEACVDHRTPYVSWDEDSKQRRSESSDPIDRVLLMLQTIDEWTNAIEPLTGSQRFGNLAFRTWGRRLDEHLDALHSELLPKALHPFITELRAYLQDSFGSFVRIDYGTGHELNFIAWLCYLHRLGFFSDGSQAENLTTAEHRLGLEVIPSYLRVVWHLQDRYSLEPAGSHGVWGLDDYQFVPYILGAAQLRNSTTLAPKDVTNKQLYPFVLEKGVRSGPRISIDNTLYYKLPGDNQLVPNMYISSLARIYSLKRGPFHEHSPLLNDIANDVPSWSKQAAGYTAFRFWWGRIHLPELVVPVQYATYSASNGIDSLPYVFANECYI